MRVIVKLLFAVALLYVLIISGGYLLKNRHTDRAPAVCQLPKNDISSGLALLKNRKDALALEIFSKVLQDDPQNIEALWGKAEVLRRQRHYDKSEEILTQALKSNPNHLPSRISLAYIRYKQDRLDEAYNLIKNTLNSKACRPEDEAMSYIMIGTINSRRTQKDGMLAKLAYAGKIKRYFLKAQAISPDLPESRLALGTFYLVAPAIIGGDIAKAQFELEAALKLAPEFATAKARLGQLYLKKGDKQKADAYFAEAAALDPENEVVAEVAPRK